jgi:hypothetical protein
MNTALEYSTRVVQEGGRQCKKSTLNDLVHLTPLRIPLMNPPQEFVKICEAGCEVPPRFTLCKIKYLICVLFLAERMCWPLVCHIARFGDFF